MKASRYLTIALIILFTSGAAKAQMTIDLSKVTCKQFITYEITDARSLSLWLSGYFNAQQNNTTVDVSKFRDRSNALKEYCFTHQGEPLMAAAKTVVSSKK